MPCSRQTSLTLVPLHLSQGAEDLLPAVALLCRSRVFLSVVQRTTLEAFSSTYARHTFRVLGTSRVSVSRVMIGLICEEIRNAFLFLEKPNDRILYCGNPE